MELHTLTLRQKNWDLFIPTTLLLSLAGCSEQLHVDSGGGQDIPRRVAVLHLGPISESGSVHLPIPMSQPLHSLQGPHSPSRCCWARQGCSGSCNTFPVTDWTLGWRGRYAKDHTDLFCLHGSKMSLERNVFILTLITLLLLSACVSPVRCSRAKEINSKWRKTIEKQRKPVVTVLHLPYAVGKRRV